VQFDGYMPKEGPDAYVVPTNIGEMDSSAFIAVNRPVQDGEEMTVLGIKMQFFTKYGSDDKVHTTVWLPDRKILFTTLLWSAPPQLYTLRFFREDCLTAEDLDLYRQSGLVACYFSGDGTSDWALELLGKGFRKKELINAARIAASGGVITVYHFLVNLPGETQKTVDEARALLNQIFEIHAGRGNIGGVVISNVRLYPGAALTESAIRDRLIDPRHDLLYPTYFNPPPWDSVSRTYPLQGNTRLQSCRRTGKTG
jgi:hypothetical protein